MLYEPTNYTDVIMLILLIFKNNTFYYPLNTILYKKPAFFRRYLSPFIILTLREISAVFERANAFLKIYRYLIQTAAAWKARNIAAVRGLGQ